jgi:hypothetical protein
MFGAQGLWAGRDLYRATRTTPRNLGLYGLIRKTGTYVPQWDSNPRRKDHQIIAPDALTFVDEWKDMSIVVNDHSINWTDTERENKEAF